MVEKVVAGGGGAGAGIGGNGGTGGNGNDNVITQGGSGYSTAFHGEEGENCGKVNIYNTLTVYAYGGAGGAGGVSSASSGGGGGGYPAAGIGGGGAGGGAGDHISGGGGYTGGNEQEALEKQNNGLAGNINEENTGDYGPGGGYLKEAEDSPRATSVPLDMYGGLLGGGGGWTSTRVWGYTYGGDGGIAGKGGIIKVSSTANIKAFNGNKFTDGTSYNEGENAVEIYAQKGQLLKIEKTLGWWTDAMNEYYSKFLNTEINYTSCWSRNQNEKVTLREAGTCEVLSYGQGIGSGAGYIELSNGTYTIDSSLN